MSTTIYFPKTFYSTGHQGALTPHYHKSDSEVIVVSINDTAVCL